MKKAKIVLSAVAFFAAIGGALAYKAQFGQGTLFHRTGTTTIAGNTYALCSSQQNYVPALAGINSTFYTLTYTTTNTPGAPVFCRTTASVVTTATLVDE